MTSYPGKRDGAAGRSIALLFCCTLTLGIVACQGPSNQPPEPTPISDSGSTMIQPESPSPVSSHQTETIDLYATLTETGQISQYGRTLLEVRGNKSSTYRPTQKVRQGRTATIFILCDELDSEFSIDVDNVPTFGAGSCKASLFSATLPVGKSSFKTPKVSFERNPPNFELLVLESR